MTKSSLEDLGYAAKEYVKSVELHALVRREQGLKPAIKYWYAREIMRDEVFRAMYQHARAT